jgi:hypothetical protein
LNSTAESGPTAGTRDTINGFTHLSDVIDLLTIDAVAGGGNNAFDFIETAAFDAAGQVRAQASGGNTLLELNTTGTTGAEASILVLGIAAATLTDPDFVL